MTNVNLLHVSAPGCHNQGIFQTAKNSPSDQRLLLWSERFHGDGTPMPKHAGD